MIRRFPVLFAVSLWVSPLSANDEALSLLTRGGGEIDRGNFAPGLIELVSENAFPVLKDASGRTVAAGGVTKFDKEESRIVAFAHDSFLKSTDLFAQSAARDLLLNSIRWSAKADAPEVALHPDLKGLAAMLEEADFRVEFVAPAEVSRRTVRSVYVTIAQRGFDEKGVESILKSLEGGAGLVLAATPWAFADDYPNFADFPANRLAATAGIRFKSSGNADGSKPFAVTFTDSSSVIDTLVGLVRDPLPSDTAKRAELGQTLKAGAALRGDSLATFIKGLKALSLRLGPIVPTPDRPLVPGADPLVDAVVALEDELNQTLPAGKMYAIAAAADYPGAVPDNAARIKKQVTLDGTWKGWLSGRGSGGWAAKEMRPTGLYAAAGEVITVTAPAEIVGRGFEVVIGAYGGGLENRDKWERYPHLQRSVAIEGPVTTVSNGFGGLVTIRVPRGAEFASLDFTIAGAVEAPLYVAGKTDLREWRERIREFPAPWAELASERFIIAIPSRFIRKLEDPDEVLQVWNEIIEKAAELSGGVDRNAYRAERIVFERQPSVGYMHSGYPVAAPQDRSAEIAVDARALREEGNWGFFHEYGHNHQHDLWSLPGTGETTCNLWSVYLFEEFVGKKREEGHGAMRALDRRQRMNDYFDKGRNFESDWGVWTALETYLQVQEAFGWEPFKKVFAEYNSLPEAEWPKSQQEKNDQWVIRLSRACGKNLAPYWKTWNVPLSDSVSADLADLPVWGDTPVAKWAK